MCLLFVGACHYALAAADDPPAPAADAPPVAVESVAVESAPPPTATPAAPAAPAAPVIEFAPPPAAPPADPQLPARYRIVDAADAPGGWQVLDAEAHTLDSMTLATALNDEAALTTLRHDKSFARVTDGVLLGVGVGLAAGGVYALTLAGPAIEVGERPDPVEYPEYPDWRADADAWEARMALADVRDEQLWSGVTLLTGAVLTGVLVPLTGQDAQARAEHPALLWDRAALLRSLVPTVSVAPGMAQLSWVLP